MKPKVVVDQNIPWVEHYLGDVARVYPVAGRQLSALDLQGASALLVRSVTRVDEVLLQGSSVRFVGSATSGTDHVDLEFLRAAGISFAHAPGSNANSVVEYVLAVIAAVEGPLERLLSGGQVGVVGYGVIGKLLVARLQGLGIACRVFDPWLDQSDIPCAAALCEVLACEVVSLHPELTRAQPWPSHHLLGLDELAAIPEGSLLINASRGPVIENAALMALCERGTIGAKVVLDVWEGEPAINAQLLRHVRFGSSHVAGYSVDGKLLATRMLCEKLVEIMGWGSLVREAPIAPAEIITLPDTEDDIAFLRTLLTARYDVSRDDRLLRELTLGHPPDDAAVAFDRLRREYPQRRELFGSRVVVDPRSSTQRNWLRALGCELQGSGV